MAVTTRKPFDALRGGKECGPPGWVPAGARFVASLADRYHYRHSGRAARIAHAGSPTQTLNIHKIML